MTLTVRQIDQLAHLVTANRPAWPHHEIHEQITRLAADPRPFDQLENQAIAASANPKATTPAAILWTTTARTPDRANDGWKTKPGPECPEHHNPNWRTSDGVWACCWAEQFGGRPAEETTEGAACG